MIERIKKLILSNSNEDRQIAVQLLRKYSQKEIMIILPDLYNATPWNHKKEQLKYQLKYSQDDAFYYELEHGYLCYNGFIWYSPKSRDSKPHPDFYKKIEDE